MELHADPAEEVSKLEPEWLQIILHFAAQNYYFAFRFIQTYFLISIYLRFAPQNDLFAFRSTK